MGANTERFIQRRKCQEKKENITEKIKTISNERIEWKELWELSWIIEDISKGREYEGKIIGRITGKVKLYSREESNKNMGSIQKGNYPGKKQ